MLAVTIGIGKIWRRRAESAAAAARRCTGLKVAVLGDDEFRHSRLQWAVMLKTAVFDYVSDQNILLFDADLLFSQPWNPLQYNDRPELICVRDFWFEPHIQADAARYGMPPDQYFNPALMILNRRYHGAMLAYAKRCLYERHSSFPEQGILNAARIRLRVPALFLDRRYNSLSGPECEIWKNVPLIGVHPAGELDAKVVDVSRSTAGDWFVDDPGTSQLSHQFFRYRVGEHPWRVVEFRDDGTIGMGSTSLERYWYVCRHGSEVILRFAHRQAVTAELIQQSNRVWCGKLLEPRNSESVTLAPHPFQILAELLSHTGRADQIGAEIGAGNGDNAAILLTQCPSLSLYLIDEWTPGAPQGDSADARTKMSEIDRPERMKDDAISATRFAETRRYILDHPALGATACVEDNSLSFVLLHAGTQVPAMELLSKWYPKVNAGGLVIGEDTIEDAENIVNRFADAVEAKVEHHLGGLWSFQKIAENSLKKKNTGEFNRLLKPTTLVLPSFIDAQTARTTADTFLEQLAAFPAGVYNGRGVVICGGGSRYLTCAWVCINMLRQSGCQLPIELWQTTGFEIDRDLRKLFEPLGVACVNAEFVQRSHPVRRLGGWELKPFAILHSSFREILLLDADNVPIVDPNALFETLQFKKCGAIFWPDYGRLEPGRDIWKICRVPYRNEPEFESGQIVVDKQRCWRALQLTMHINEYSDFYYCHIHGDKETFHMAWRMLDQEYAMVPFPIRALLGVMCQHDFHGKRIFQHRNLAKWSLNEPNNRIPHFQREEECFAILEDLKSKWDGFVGCDWDFNEDEERAARSVLAQGKYNYIRVGYDNRSIEFLSAGKIGEGRGDCEECWFIKKEQGDVVLVLIGRGVETCRLRKIADGVWHGRWLVHEQMPIMLVPFLRSHDGGMQVDSE